MTVWRAHLRDGKAAAAPCSAALWEETSGCQLYTTAGAGGEGWLCGQTCRRLQYQARELCSFCAQKLASPEEGNIQFCSGNCPEGKCSLPAQHPTHCRAPNSPSLKDQQLSPAWPLLWGNAKPPSPLQIPFPSTRSPFPSACSTYLASWMRTMMVHRPISPHILAVPISAKTSTHSSTLSQVRSFCWGSDCKTQKEGEEGGQDAGSACELKVAHTHTAQSGGTLRAKKVMAFEVTASETRSGASPTARGYREALFSTSRRSRTHHNIQWSCYLRNKENFTAVCEAAICAN